MRCMKVGMSKERWASLINVNLLGLNIFPLG